MRPLTSTSQLEHHGNGRENLLWPQQVAGHCQDLVPRRRLWEITPLRSPLPAQNTPSLSAVSSLVSAASDTGPHSPGAARTSGKECRRCRHQETFENSTKGWRWGRCSVLPALQNPPFVCENKWTIWDMTKLWTFQVGPLKEILSEQGISFPAH